MLALFVIASGIAATCGDAGLTIGAATVDAQPADAAVPLPNKADSFKFGVLGDFGTASKEQYQLAAQMAKLHERVKYGLVILVGDNLYGSERPQDFKVKFEEPYKPLLDAGVKFYATLGNHDAREQRYYKLFNMDGKLYYTFSPAPEIRFFMLESTYPVPEQIAWVEQELKASSSKWKIVVFHHPLYSSGERHGSDVAPSRGAGAALREVRRQRRAHGARSLLRAGEAAERHRVLRRGIGGQAAGWQHRSRLRSHCERVRHRPGLHGR